MEGAGGHKPEVVDSKRTKCNKQGTKELHILRKRRPQRLEESDSVIYVSTKTSTKALLDRCNKLINKGEKEITIYCLGASIQRGILLALKLCEQHVAFNFHTNTFTSELIDDLEPLTDESDYYLQRRLNSAIKIRLFKSDLLESKT